MRQYTTPTLTITVKGVDLTEADAVYVTLANNERRVVITKESPEMSVVGEDTIVTVTLSQEETKRFQANSRVDVEVNWMVDSARYATTIASLVAAENLLKEVLPSE